MDTEQTIVNSRKDVILSVRNLMKDFPVGQSSKNNMMRAVNDVSFELRKGEALAIVGESGSGKSTGARVLTRIYDKTAGDIEFKGEPLADYIKKHGARVCTPSSDDFPRPIWISKPNGSWKII